MGTRRPYRKREKKVYVVLKENTYYGVFTTASKAFEHVNSFLPGDPRDYTVSQEILNERRA